MIIDKLTEFGDSFDLTEVAGTYLFTNQVDLEETGMDPAAGKQVYVVVNFDVSTDSAGDAETVQFRIASDDTAAIHASTSTQHFLSKAFVQSEMVAGSTYIFPLPITDNYERYLGVQAIIAGATITAGAASAYLTLDPGPYWKPAPDQFA